jgi:hypothetical protein
LFGSEGSDVLDGGAGGDRLQAFVSRKETQTAFSGPRQLLGA